MMFVSFLREKLAKVLLTVAIVIFQNILKSHQRARMKKMKCVLPLQKDEVCITTTNSQINAELKLQKLEKIEKREVIFAILLFDKKRSDYGKLEFVS